MLIPYIVLLAILFVLSMFFSAAETAYFSVRGYSLAKTDSKSKLNIRLAIKLLEQPDRLLVLVLFGNNFVNVSIAAIFTLLTVRLSGEHLLFFSSLAITLLILIFCEVIPKSFALRYAFVFIKLSSPILFFLWRILEPILSLINTFLKMIHRIGKGKRDAKEGEKEKNFFELRSAVLEARHILSEPHRNMLMSILDIRTMLTEEVMIRVGDFESFDIKNNLSDILRETVAAYRSHLVVYRNNLNVCLGFIQREQLLALFRTTRPTRKMILSLVEKATYIPGGITLLNQLQHFVDNDISYAFVVDEYGDIQGMISLHDLIGRITGQIGSLVQTSVDGSLLVNGDTSLREINNRLGVNLDLTQYTTLQGLMQERVESLLAGPICILEKDCRIQIDEVIKGRIVKARIWRESL